MPSHSIILSAANSPAAYTLSYSEQPTGKTQRQFQNRICLQPEIDLKAYSCRAVIDWVDVRFRTVDHTQRKWIKHHIDRAIGEKIFSEKKKVDDDGKYREFRVRIQEPVTQDLLLAEEVVRAKWGLQQPAEIIGLEVSVDWTPRKQSDQALALMFGVVTRSHLPSRDIMADPFDRPRFTWAKGRSGTAYVLGQGRTRSARRHGGSCAASPLRNAAGSCRRSAVGAAGWWVHRERDEASSGSLLKKPVMLCRHRTTLNANATSGQCPLPQPQAPSRAAVRSPAPSQPFSLVGAIKFQRGIRRLDSVPRSAHPGAQI